VGSPTIITIIEKEKIMYCTFCGTENNDGAKFCANCGSPLEARQQEEKVEEAQYSYEPIDLTTTLREAEKDRQGASLLGTGITAMVFSCVTFFLSFVGIILAAVGLGKARSFERNFTTLDGKAKVGKILSTIALIIGIIMTVFSVLYFALIIVIIVESLGGEFDANGGFYANFIF
jgi:uncharacterized membrane protein YidH (DUF202 family)